MFEDKATDFPFLAKLDESSESSNDPEVSYSDENSENPTKKDYQLLLLMIFLKLGDGIEIYLPGVITQTVSCVLGISEFQESVLAVIFYIFLSITILMSAFISKRLGERVTLILSLYLSIVFAILCAIVPNFYTLLLSRVLTGICVGLNGSISGIFLAKFASSKAFVTKSSFLAEGLGIPVGAAWVSLLGWLILDLAGWRVFILLTSIPFFIPPIILLHCCLQAEAVEKYSAGIDLITEKRGIPYKTYL